MLPFFPWQALIRSVTSAETAEKFFDSDQAWKAACPPEAVSLLDFIWKVIFGPKHDAQLKNLLKQSRTPEELMGVAPFVEEIQSMTDEAEQKKDEEAGVLATNHMQDEVGCNSRVRCTSAKNHMQDEVGCNSRVLCASMCLRSCLFLVWGGCNSLLAGFENADLRFWQMVALLESISKSCLCKVARVGPNSSQGRRK